MLLTGVIVKGIGGFYYIKAEDGAVYECKARGVFRKEKIKPMIGDVVRIESDGEKGNIVAIQPRKTELIRPSVANIDTLVIVAATASPEPNLFLIDKMLVLSEQQGIRPILCLNKEDLHSGDELEKIYRTAGYPVVRVSAKTGEGVAELRALILGKTSAFTGLSGVGKSSILTLLLDAVLQTGAVSDKIQRGKHTTRHVELFELPGGGFVLDTPGFSSLEAEGITASELYGYFPELAEVTGCRFKGCSHISEPDCAVKALLAQGKIAASRYESYKALYELLKQKKDWE